MSLWLVVERHLPPYMIDSRWGREKTQDIMLPIRTGSGYALATGNGDKMYFSTAGTLPGLSHISLVGSKSIT